MKTKIILILLVLVIFTFGCVQSNGNNEEKFICGGIGGISCPNGYYCKMGLSSKWISDAGGICQKIDLDKAANCLKKRDVSIVCNTKFDCTKERELLGDLFQYFKVKYDDESTNCNKYGNLCEKEYNDTEMIGWIIPNKSPYRTEYNKYPDPSFRGTRTMESALWIAACNP